MKTQHCKGAFAVHAACSAKQCSCKCHERRLYIVKVREATKGRGKIRIFVVNAGYALEAEEAVGIAVWPAKVVSVTPAPKQVMELK